MPVLWTAPIDGAACIAPSTAVNSETLVHRRRCCTHDLLLFTTKLRNRWP